MRNNFILDLTRPAHYCTLHSIKIPYEKYVTEIEKIIGPQEHIWSKTHYLNKNQLNDIAKCCNVEIDPVYVEGNISVSSIMDRLSYPLHTGRELDLMLERIKPLSVFDGVVGFPDCDYTRLVRKNFLPHVKNGAFTYRKTVIKTGKKYDHILEFYALPEQAWRIDAYLLLTKTAAVTGWTEAVLRMEGSLYGYTDQQNDEYIQLERLMRGDGLDGFKNAQPL